MRVSIPTIPHVLNSANKPTISPAEAAERIAQFLASGNVTLLTGAGVSVDSGIKAYRGQDGRYMNPNYKPIFYHELIEESDKGFAFRQRYWLRSYLGYPPVRDALPNTTHYAIAALQYTNHISQLITQNVDGLHFKAISRLWTESRIKEHILELHGTLHRVHCKFGHVTERDEFQDRLSNSNPTWKEFVDNLERTGNKPKTNPDGDVELEGVSYSDYVVPECPDCMLEGRRNSIQKPEVIFFGESIPTFVKNRSFSDVEKTDKLFLMGTTLATYSAYRLVKRALELRKPVLMLNVGPTRADDLPGVEKIEIASGLVMRDVVKNVLGFRAIEDPNINYLLRSGVSLPPTN
ncbi:DHS-like NAD/FAD-binding domain-containing protein [Coniophora puteana RWD-64-598 SS2]|uniref:DHS-like NAD/FAD-binding domain-containing protein n=1 Tax=Coniophora puteana (strain RWD-64-598) TaxID=741705 RepID=A0A5M3MK82_CONPW|nr:DHS-like NAD/FAD-binding domain-containing protein [Coniophora puteana RWD-64-598 SS2]EIW79427.1 DHS-like NAD/FAD-binding domain-containing protein [Coniophora puteana RWD-64-598 SS2]